MAPQSIISRIQKLLALSESTNPHEAALAAGEAARLLTEHQLTTADLADENPDDKVGEHTLQVGSRAQTWHSVLVNGIARSVGCTAIVRRRNKKAHFVVIGHQSSNQTVTYLWQYLTREVDRLAEHHWTLNGTGNARAWKNAFRCGAATAIAQRLIAQRELTKQQHSHERALVLLDKREDAVKAYVGSHFRIRKPRKANTTSVDGKARGVMAGRKVTLDSSGSLTTGTSQLNT